MQTKLRYATGRLNAVRTPAKLSDFILHVDSLDPGTPVVLLVRASTRTQRKRLPHQRSNLELQIKKRRLKIIAVFVENAPGWRDVCEEYWGRLTLEKAILKAKESNVVLVAESADRFKRGFNPEWKKNHRQPPLTVNDMQRLIDEVGGVRLATLLHPDTPPNEVRSYQSKRGQKGTGKYGGRPPQRFPKKKRRVAKAPEALEMRSEGFSWGQISRALKVPRSTVRDWTKHLKNPHTLPH